MNTIAGERCLDCEHEVRRQEIENTGATSYNCQGDKIQF